jgi:endonuclease YncB( thermonuclease family)
MALAVLSAEPLFARAFERFRFTGTVTRVKDGDSIMVRRDDVGRVVEIRLAGIDAPELAQPWGIQSRSALRRLVLQQKVTVEVTDRDRYNRLVGRVWQGRVYVNARMTQDGHAWAFDRYLPDPAIRAGQDAARKAGRGLWSLPPEQRLPPPTWRARNPRQG